MSVQYIINCIAGNVSKSIPSSEAWDDITITAIVLGLAPLLHRQLQHQNVAPPPMAMAKLSVTRQAHTKRNEAIAHQLAEILAACQRQDIPVIVLKGALLADMAYPEAGLRPMNDIDLLFQPGDLPRLAHLLESLGYEGKHKDADQGPGITKHLSTYRRAGDNGNTPNPYLSAAADRTVEPHGSLEESWFGLKVNITPGVWDRAVPVILHRQPAFRLSTCDMVLHLAVHATFHVIMRTAVFVQLYDIGRVIETWSNELDWAQVIDLTKTANAQPFVYAGLTWAQTLYQANVPADCLQMLQADCSPDLLDYIHRLDAVALFEHTQQPPLNGFAQRLRRGVLDRLDAARWAGSSAAKWRVWQTALAVHKTDTASLLLGERLKTRT